MIATTITLTETAAPSNSNERGWLATSDAFASPDGREVHCKMRDIITLVLCHEARHSTVTDRRWQIITVVVTGDPDDVVEVSIGSPQPYAATITGAVEA